jgi:GGDEF domain-containing protein
LKQVPPVEFAELERRELRLTVFACTAIVVLTAGLALLMYPAVFANPQVSLNRTPQIAFFGFCGLSALLVTYIIDRQVTIRSLRQQMADDRKHASSAREQASIDLLKSLPNFSSFQDRLPMEYRRASATSQALSILVVNLALAEDYLAPSAARAAVGDAGKAVLRKLREQDSIYLLRPTCLGIALPGMTTAAARSISARIAEGLSDVAGTHERFSFTINVINYPEQASSAHELEGLVRAAISEEEDSGVPEVSEKVSAAR